MMEEEVIEEVQNTKHIFIVKTNDSSLYSCETISSSILFSTQYYYFCLLMICMNVILLIWVRLNDLIYKKRDQLNNNIITRC